MCKDRNMIPQKVFKNKHYMISLGSNCRLATSYGLSVVPIRILVIEYLRVVSLISVLNIITDESTKHGWRNNF